MIPVQSAAKGRSGTTLCIWRSYWKNCKHSTKKSPLPGAFARADDGTRTHDLLHGKYMRNVPVRSEVAWLNASAS